MYISYILIILSIFIYVNRQFFIVGTLSQIQNKRNIILGVNSGTWNSYAHFCKTNHGGNLINLDSPSALKAFEYFTTGGRIFQSSW